MAPVELNVVVPTCPVAQITQQKDGLEKRQATLQFCFGPAPGMKQPKLTIIFKGQGLKISTAERKAWDPRVHVMFQQKAWVDRATAMRWADEVMAPYVKDLQV